MYIRTLLLCYLILNSFISSAQKIIPLYSREIPNAIPNNMKEDTMYWGGKFGGYRNISTPTLEIYLPAKEISNGTAVVICPGGGYGTNTYQGEGINIANSFIKQGVAAFILKYRLPSDAIMKDKMIGPLQDAQQAIKTVRQNAKEWNVDVNKIGIMGFSAGGHLASSAATHFDSSFIANKEKISLRPDFLILVYPVMSFTDKLAHMGSRKNLLGDNPGIEKINFFSGELNVTDKTPPAWITHAADDRAVNVENSIVFYQALKAHHVPAEMHLFAKGDHGFVLNIPVEQWMGSVYEWMRSNSWIK